MVVAADDNPNVRANHCCLKVVRIAQSHPRHRLDRRRYRRMVECDYGAVGRGRAEFGGEERERLSVKLTVILTRDRGIEADDSQSTAPVHLIDRRIRRLGAEEVTTELS